MYHRISCLLAFFLLFVVFMILGTNAYAQVEACQSENRSCILEQLLHTTSSIENKVWKDQTYREIAKTFAFDRDFEKAVSIIGMITTPDTKAMTIRGIGMTVAAQNYAQKELDTMFSTLREKAEQIEHPPSYAIALTYIAMAQAFAGDNDGAWKTASSMKNDALRFKAYGETAEIQAEKGDFKSARISIEKIKSLSFRNKAYAIVSRILSDHVLFDDAYLAAQSITNSYKKAQALQYILDVQRPRKVKH